MTFPWSENIFRNAVTFPGLESKFQVQWLLTVWTLVSPWHFVLQFQVWISLAKQSGLKNEAMHVLCVYRFYFLLLSLGFSFPYSSRLYQDDSLPQFSFLSFEPSVIYTGEWVHWHCQSCQIKPTVVSRMLHCILGHRNLNSDAAKQLECGNYKICEYQRDTVSQSFFFSSVISHSSDLLPKMGLQNNARQDFARIWGVNNPEMSHKRCWKWCQITNVI